MRIERCMENEKKNKVVKEDPCAQTPSRMQGGERHNENRRYALGVQQRRNFKTRSYVPFGSKMSHGRKFSTGQGR